VIVVSNASPLIILAKIGHLELLNVLYGRILVPSEVRAEVVTRDAGLPGAHQVAQADWLDVRQLSDPATLSAAEAQSPLARGELAAILLAEELSADPQ
jgi:predicted nucleic acid-binding protein